MSVKKISMSTSAMFIAAAAIMGAGCAPSSAQDANALANAGKDGKDWMSYHGSYQSWHYSPLSQIDASNVKKLKIGVIHQVGHSTRGVQSTPLAKDGVVYYSASYSKVFAVKGDTGEVLWSFIPKLDDDLVARQTHSPYNRGMAMGDDKLYIGTVDGRLIAIDTKTGKPAWDTKLIDSEKLTVGFTGAPIFARGNVIIGAQGGEWPSRGPLFAVDAATGKKKWEFFTSGGTPEAMKTWGNDTWRVGGGGGWMPGTFDPKTNAIWWGVANPAPLYDWAGSDWKTTGARPGDNLYTSSVIALDLDTGKLKFYHQELPHDTWDFDSAIGEFVEIDRDGQKLMVHPNKSGYIFVYNRADASLENVWPLVK